MSSFSLLVQQLALRVNMDKEEKANVVIFNIGRVNMDKKERANVVIFIVGTSVCS